MPSDADYVCMSLGSQGKGYLIAWDDSAPEGINLEKTYENMRLEKKILENEDRKEVNR